MKIKTIGVFLILCIFSLGQMPHHALSAKPPKEYTLSPEDQAVLQKASDSLFAAHATGGKEKDVRTAWSAWVTACEAMKKKNNFPAQAYCQLKPVSISATVPIIL